MNAFVRVLASLPRWTLMAPVGVYRLTLSRIMPLCCRFEPSCSGYVFEALRRHGALRGGWLGLRRILRCHPWCEGGSDPVPEERPKVRRPTAAGGDQAA